MYLFVHLAPNYHDKAPSLPPTTHGISENAQRIGKRIEGIHTCNEGGFGSGPGRLVRSIQPIITKNFRYIKWRYWTLSTYKAFLGVGFPLHKPYPYSLYDGEDSSIFGYLKCSLTSYPPWVTNSEWKPWKINGTGRWFISFRGRKAYFSGVNWRTVRFGEGICTAESLWKLPGSNGKWGYVFGGSSPSLYHHVLIVYGKKSGIVGEKF